MESRSRALLFAADRDEPPDTVGLLLLIEILPDATMLSAHRAPAASTIVDPLRHSDGEYSIEVIMQKPRVHGMVKDIAHRFFNSPGSKYRGAMGMRLARPSSPLVESAELRAAMESPRRHSLVSPDRMFMLLQWLDFALAAPGEVAEFGVWRGGTALLLRDRLASRRTLHLFDSFAGLPQANPAEG